MNFKYFILVVVLLLMGFSLTFIALKPGSISSQKLQISASVYPLYYFAQEIGGDKVDVSLITPSSAEPHDYEPTAQDIAHIDKSRVLLLNGGGLEVWAGNIEQ